MIIITNRLLDISLAIKVGLIATLRQLYKTTLNNLVRNR